MLIGPNWSEMVRETGVASGLVVLQAMDLRQGAAVTRRHGCLRYVGVVDSWIDSLLVAARF